MLRRLWSSDIRRHISLKRPTPLSLLTEATSYASIFPLAWTSAYLLGRLIRQTTKEPSADPTPQPSPPRRTRRLQRRLLRCSIPFGQPTGNDPGWCFLTLAPAPFRPYLIGLGPYPSPVKVLNTLRQLGPPGGAPLKIGQLHHPGDCKPFEIPIRLTRDRVKLRALVDTGATGYGFIDASFAASRGYLTESLPTPRHLQVIDGRPIASGAITQICKLRLEIDAHVEGISLFVTQLGDTKVVLGLPWLQHHAARVNFANRHITFHADRCQQHTADSWATTLASKPLIASATRAYDRTLPPGFQRLAPPPVPLPLRASSPPPPIPPRMTTGPPPIPPRPTAPRRTITISAARFHRELQQQENQLFLLAARPTTPDKPRATPAEELNLRLAAALQALKIAAVSLNRHDELRAALRKDPLSRQLMKDIANKKKHSRFLPIGECSIRDGLLYYQGLIYIPDDAAIKLEVLRTNHDAPSAGHPGRARTLELLSRNYYWPQMRKYVARYVDHCDTCSRIKPVRHAPYGLLKPLTPPTKPWSSLSMDHVTGLPESQGSNAILVVVDRLTKMAHYIPTRDTADAAELARLFLQHVWTSHGLPKDIVSDRGTTFTSQFWRTLCNQLDIKPRFSTAFHPQTDGQTERVNAIMEQYLRGYVNYQQDNWSEFLPLAEFAHNNATTEPLGVSPFFANYGYNPQLDTLPSEERHESTPKEVVDFANSISTLQAALRSEILYAQAAATDSANAARLPEPHLEVGDMVWLSRKHIRTTRPSDKLDHKRLGKFRILERIGSHAYRLELPASMKSHPVFHVSSLEPARRHPLPGHIQPPPPPVIVEGEEEFEVQEVMDSRIRRNQLQYLVKWTGYEQPTWEPARNLDAELGSLQRFHSLYPSKPSRDATKPKARKV
ncbi:uncharacterized protein LAJ45_11360 [Morchella importuna]|uniref:uncharacterized protein n=1 Tax=Morchella importuna TaxID=1174673 RepID=UPI001E8E774E|nr:uncharacterized protein LAJ45_11360 [Morchella importuna]KAH8144651.1 hypothetical protein LAJ45_11360 [Morchella importuna]